MSNWQTHVDAMTSSGVVKKAAIYDTQGVLGGATDGFALQGEEFKGLYMLFAQPGDAFTSGVVVNGVTYLTLRAEADKIYGRKGTDGVVVARTGKTFIIGVHDEGSSTQAAAVVVEGLADQLRGTGN
ncbi:profilin [Streptomyces sp. NPDC002082]|uniref:profilin n=1 Tax=Streptomyces sp. NPDC002082 TaxID=3154772 RepID=UPI0033169B7A